MIIDPNKHYLTWKKAVQYGFGHHAIDLPPVDLHKAIMVRIYCQAPRKVRADKLCSSGTDVKSSTSSLSPLPNSPSSSSTSESSPNGTSKDSHKSSRASYSSDRSHSPSRQYSNATPSTESGIGQFLGPASTLVPLGMPTLLSIRYAILSSSSCRCRQSGSCNLNGPKRCL